MDFAQATESPIVESVRGTQISFPLLNIEDYIPWVAEINTQRKQKSKTLIPKAGDPIDLFRMQRMAEFDESNMDAVSVLVWTPKGAKRVLEMSLAKTAYSEADRAEIIKSISARRVISLAGEVSALYEKKVPPLPAKGKPDPNDETAQSQSAENSDEIGS